MSFEPGHLPVIYGKQKKKNLLVVPRINIVCGFHEYMWIFVQIADVNLHAEASKIRIIDVMV
jgi:hypothetical protein